MLGKRAKPARLQGQTGVTDGRVASTNGWLTSPVGSGSSIHQVPRHTNLKGEFSSIQRGEGGSTSEVGVAGVVIPPPCLLRGAWGVCLVGRASLLVVLMTASRARQKSESPVCWQTRHPNNKALAQDSGARRLPRPRQTDFHELEHGGSTADSLDSGRPACLVEGRGRSEPRGEELGKEGQGGERGATKAMPCSGGASKGQLQLHRLN